MPMRDASSVTKAPAAVKRRSSDNGDNTSEGIGEISGVVESLKNVVTPRGNHGAVALIASAANAAAELAGVGVTASGTWENRGEAILLPLPETLVPDSWDEIDISNGCCDEHPSNLHTATGALEEATSPSDKYDNLRLRVEVWQGTHVHGQVCRHIRLIYAFMLPEWSDSPRRRSDCCQLHGTYEGHISIRMVPSS